ncbi:MAG: hypothetical protein QF721_04695 [Verrucomicrobiota bacterium]|nr:hypothetical protein [Verrucomicrobiota bacterium]
MNSLEQFLLLAVQNAEQESDIPPEFIAILIALFVFLFIAVSTFCWFYAKKCNPNITARQFWTAMFSGPSGGGGD